MTKTLQIRLNEDLRAEAETVLQEIGLDVPSAVRLFLSQVVRTRSIPFELKAPGIRVTEVAVDAAHQRQMDEIGTLWSQRKPEQG
jgi:DNA-damage-inducible protein J